MKIMSKININSNNIIPQKSESGNEPKDVYTPGEIGADKETTQHISNAGFGTTSAISLKDNLKTLLKLTSKKTSRFKFVRFVPGLNFGVATLETYHAVKYLKKNEPIVAATSAGNAAGCMSSFLEEAATCSAFAAGARHSLLMRWTGSALGIIGGALGIVAGCEEIKEGIKIKKAGGTSRTLTMGILDIASGATSTAGAILLSSRLGGVLGLPLLIAASVFDLSGIGVDYLWKKSEKKAEEKSSENTNLSPS